MGRIADGFESSPEIVGVFLCGAALIAVDDAGEAEGRVDERVFIPSYTAARVQDGYGVQAAAQVKRIFFDGVHTERNRHIGQARAYAERTIINVCQTGWNAQGDKARAVLERMPLYRCHTFRDCQGAQTLAAAE